MKRFFKQFVFLAAVALTLMFASCLKDTQPTDYTDIAPVVIIPNANWPKNTATADTSITVSTTPTIIRLYARYSYKDFAPSDIAVTFVKDEADIALYNAKFPPVTGVPAYIPVPDAAISVPSLKITIPAGGRTVAIPVSVNTSLLDKTKKYILPYKITDASGQTLGVNYITYLRTIALK